MTLPRIPSPWLIIAAALLLGGTWLHGANYGHEKARKDAAIEVAQANATATREKARIEAENAAKDAAQAQATRDLEAEYHAKIKAADAGRADFERTLNNRLRNAEARYSHCKLSSTAADPSSPESTGTGDARLGLVSPSGVSRIREVGKQLQADLALCKAWVNQVGR